MRRPFLALAACLAFILAGAGLASQGGTSSFSAQGPTLATARLLKGPEPVKGLPFFGTNALAALSGVYDVAGKGVRVWSCRERLWLSPEWKPSQSGFDSISKVYIMSSDAGFLCAFVAKDYYLFVELPADSPALRRFASALEKRFAVFFQNAASDAELSFPAYVDFRN